MHFQQPYMATACLIPNAIGCSTGLLSLVLTLLNVSHALCFHRAFPDMVPDPMTAGGLPGGGQVLA